LSFFEILGIVLAGTGTFASILGTFLTKASRENGRATRELMMKLDEIAGERHREIVEFLKQQQEMLKQNQETLRQNQEFLRQNQEFLRQNQEIMKRGFRELLQYRTT
jgi:uncharacterized protein with von Willebrand factor type A (vWA) domain